MTDKDKYREYCESGAGVPLFISPWWLDLVCGDGWDVIICEKGGRLLAALPFVLKRKFGIKVISSPKFTQTMGIWLSHSDAKYAKRLAAEKKLVKELISKLPPHHVFFQSFNYRFDNWLPLYNLGFEQTTKYTYVIEDLSDIDVVWSGTAANIRTDIRKAEKILYADHHGSTRDMYGVIEKTYSRQGVTVPFCFSEYKSLVDSVTASECGRIILAKDSDGNVHAGAFIVWDSDSAYYLFGGGDPELRNSGAASFCLWEAIKVASVVTKKFDFEGSMAEGVERFFRGFGGKQKAYSRIIKFNSIFLAIVYQFRKYYTKKI